MEIVNWVVGGVLLGLAGAFSVAGAALAVAHQARREAAHRADAVPAPRAVLPPVLVGVAWTLSVVAAWALMPDAGGAVRLALVLGAGLVVSLPALAVLPSRRSGRRPRH